ncbi:MAG: lasso peptide biosynthesis PqqD family chaperone [Chloroflexi bacterium]|nr:MAG: lasso peptide biosynthesis PqqD family chaperone [Chloroflexota bacterium]
MTLPKSRHAVSLSSVVVAGKGQISSDLAGEAVILNLQTGMYYGLARVGARIWELIREPTRVADVRDAIVLEYDVDPARCQHDLLCLLEQLADTGLIEIRDGMAP